MPHAVHGGTNLYSSNPGEIELGAIDGDTLTHYHESGAIDVYDGNVVVGDNGHNFHLGSPGGCQIRQTLNG
jgi:hypothetical protein